MSGGAGPEPRLVAVREATIRLGQLLKLADLVDAGSDAKALLAEAGHPNGIMVKVIQTQLPEMLSASQVFQAQLKRAGKDDLLATLRATYMDSGAIAYIRQHRALGLGHAV